MTDLAYMGAAEMAGRIRRRELSPVEVMEATIARIEQRNPSLNALIFLDFDGARKEARHAEDAVMRGDAARAAARRALGDQGPVRLQAGLAGDLRRRPRAQGQHRPLVLPLRRADREGRRDPRRQDQRPGDGASRHLRQPAVRTDPQPVRHAPQCRRLVGRQRRGGRRRPPAARRGHRRRRLDPHPGGLVRRLRLQGLLRPRARSSSGRMPLPATCPSSSKARSRGPSRTPRSP